MRARLISSEAFLLNLLIAIFSLFLHIIILPCVSCPNSSSYKDTIHIGLGSSLKTSFEVNHLHKAPIAKYTHFLMYRRLKCQHVVFVHSIFIFSHAHTESHMNKIFTLKWVVFTFISIWVKLNRIPGCSYK